VSGVSEARRRGDRDLGTRADVHDLVVHFYREVALDDLLGPVFGEVAEVDWAVHIPRLIDYWSLVLLGDRGYDGAILARRILDADWSPPPVVPACPS
jgi:truncated hemoglobin YjbI